MFRSFGGAYFSIRFLPAEECFGRSVVPILVFGNNAVRLSGTGGILRARGFSVVHLLSRMLVGWNAGC